MSDKVQGVFCVEGDWSSDLTDRASVRDMLEMLESVDGVPFIHEQVSDSEDALMRALRKWKQKQYASYSIGYFAFHGKPGKILLGRHPVSLEDIGTELEGACKGRVLYFGSCSVLQIPADQIAAFRETTKADAIIGFDRDVSWLASAALDLILLETLAMNPDEAKVEEWLRKEYGTLARHLGLRMFYGGS